MCVYLLRFCQVQLPDEVTEGVALLDEQQITAQAVPPLWRTERGEDKGSDHNKNTELKTFH